MACDVAKEAFKSLSTRLQAFVADRRCSTVIGGYLKGDLLAELHPSGGQHWLKYWLSYSHTNPVGRKGGVKAVVSFVDTRRFKEIVKKERGVPSGQQV
jgi:hypothetical protein